MLAPGEYLINPDPPKPVTTPLAGPVIDSTPVVVPVQKSDAERPSFLLILLRALGAVHT